MDADIQELADKLEQAVEGGSISEESAMQSLLLAGILEVLSRIKDALEAQQENEPVRYTPFCECGERLPCSCSTSRVEL